MTDENNIRHLPPRADDALNRLINRYEGSGVLIPAEEVVGAMQEMTQATLSADVPPELIERAIKSARADASDLENVGPFSEWLAQFRRCLTFRLRQELGLPDKG